MKFEVVPSSSELKGVTFEPMKGVVEAGKDIVVTVRFTSYPTLVTNTTMTTRTTLTDGATDMVKTSEEEEEQALPCVLGQWITRTFNLTLDGGAVQPTTTAGEDRCPTQVFTLVVRAYEYLVV